MSLAPWDPWKEMRELKAQTDRLWDDFLQKLTQTRERNTEIAFLPDVDFIESLDEYRLYLSIPGLIEEDIEIQVDRQTLIVRGERQAPYDLRRAQIREWRYGFFEREFQFQRPVRRDTVRATYESGVLTIVIAKAS